MPNDYQTALLLQKQYDGVQGVFDKTITIGGDVLSINQEDDGALGLNFEGSHDFLNWWDNFQAVMVYPKELNGAGVEEGFWRNLPSFAEALLPLMPKDRLIRNKGHSRGGGMADPFTALLIYHGYTLLENVTFGRPNCGDEALARILAPYPNRSYWNYGNWLKHDPVGDGPPHLLFPFTQTSKRRIVKVPPGANDNWGDFLGWHHLSPNYATGVQEYLNAAASQ